jgi:transcriptional regulator GlxA family with amidase domain
VDARVTAVLDMLHRMMAEQISIPLLCKHVNLAPARLRQLFKLETGRSPMQYLKDLRLSEAERLIANTFISIKEVTVLTGARDVSHFVRDFKARYGSTPSEFRTLRQSSAERAKRRRTTGE